MIKFVNDLFIFYITNLFFNISDRIWEIPHILLFKYYVKNLIDSYKIKLLLIIVLVKILIIFYKSAKMQQEMA
jgi:hypothetical protein